MRKPLETLIGPLFWPLAVLQPQTQSSQASSSESLRDPAETVLEELVFRSDAEQASQSPSETLATLSFLPVLSKDYVTALQANRYAIFPPPSSSANSKSRNGSSVPPDVFVGDKVRQAVQKYVRLVTQYLEKVELGLETAAASQHNVKRSNASPAKTASAPIVIPLEIWRTRCALWNVVKIWGGYFEGDDAWRLLVTDTVAVAAQWLLMAGCKTALTPASSLPENDSMDQSQHEVYACVEKLFSTLLELDYGACEVDVDNEGKVLFAASLLVSTAACTMV